jgi:gamma-glutamyltranspeptidase/glutathione hydrolase
VLVEPELAAGRAGGATVAALRRRGHEIGIEPEPSTFGYGQAIWRLPNGCYVAGSEPRADGAAVGH